jgi:phosphoglycolate phosphatase
MTSGPPAIPGVLLDLDGTIMDSQEGILQTMRHTLRAVGCEVPSDDVLFSWIGPSFPTSLRRWTSLDDAGVDRAVAEYSAYYSEVGEHLSVPFPGMVDLIHDLAGSGVTLALATSKPRSQALRMLERVGVLHLFAAKGAASDDEKRGTKSEVIEDALAELSEKGIDAAGYAMVGDRIHDIEAAREHGLIPVAVAWGYGNSAEWAHADHTVHSPEDLRDFILNGIVAVSPRS